jgi:hypothetical protein
MKEKYKFLYWLIIVCCMVLVSAIAQNFHLWEIMNVKDATKISWAICAITAGASLSIGIAAYKQNASLHQMNILWFIADAMIYLGMIGTVFGFLIMMGDGFNGINIADPTSIQKILQSIGTGMGTILVTTVMGLISSLLLKFQLVVIDHEE